MYFVSRTESFAKLFFLVSFTGLCTYVALAFYSFHTAYSNLLQTPGHQDRYLLSNLRAERYTRDLKYILIWPFNNETNIEEGQTPFIVNDCLDLNCYITTNKSLLNGYYTNFDAIVFNFTASTKWQRFRLPKHRLQHQKYVFYTKLPSEDHPICNLYVNNYFNWTWTYKLSSDIFSPFIEVKDLDGKVVAPKSYIKWLKNTQDVQNITKKEFYRNDIKNQIDINKDRISKRALAWVMNNCDSRSIRNIDKFVIRLEKALKEHALVLDIYGCQHKKCPGERCPEFIARNYYFYLAYEGSFTTDYVTDEVLKAYDHNIVPVVYGGADYSKFLPDGSYINAQVLSPEKLASLIAYVIRSSSIYNDFFQWKSKYIIKKFNEDKGLCQLCTLLNDKRSVKSFSSYKNFKSWWHPGSLRDKCLPKGAENYSEVLSYMNLSRMKF